VFAASMMWTPVTQLGKYSCQGTQRNRAGFAMRCCAVLREQFSERPQNTRYWAQPRTLRA
jgi:hypothetical protein